MAFEIRYVFENQIRWQFCFQNTDDVEKQIAVFRVVQEPEFLTFTLV